MNHSFVRVVLLVATCLFYSVTSHMALANCTNTGYNTIKKTISFGSVMVSSSMPVGQVLAEIKTENTGEQYGRCDSGGGTISYAMDYSQTTSGNHVYNTNLPGIGIVIKDNGTSGIYFEYPAISQHASTGNYYDSQQTVQLIKTADSVSTGALTSAKSAHIAIGEGDSFAEVVQISLNNSSIIDSDDSTGAKIAQSLTEKYNEKLANCGSSRAPAFLCSGVLLRGTDSYSSAYHSWDPSPASVTSGGVSFSYLRADSKYSKLAYSYNNGFIFFPYFYAPDGEGIDTNIDVMCSFPIDASTENRNNKGCGASNSYPTQSVPCQQQNITTASEWYNHYTEGKQNHLYQCGFLTNDDSHYNTADAFYQSILSMSTISSESFNEQNELRLATWAQGKQDSLPIEAFFYIAGSNQGLNSARSSQQDFYNSTMNKRWVPVIEMTLPATPEQNATFAFNTADQLIPDPAALRN